MGPEADTLATVRGETQLWAPHQPECVPNKITDEEIFGPSTRRKKPVLSFSPSKRGSSRVPPDTCASFLPSVVHVPAVQESGLHPLIWDLPSGHQAPEPAAGPRDGCPEALRLRQVRSRHSHRSELNKTVEVTTCTQWPT